ncbi:NusA-like transcription termination signal-binding factor [Halomicrobium sp. IBSBa]|uniref:Probable transcription termination protein NusA n=1 Tax=Halomicrobium mukohataei TaxID=57705 RepID=A0A847UCF3_9EURY|nr:MULTISPECIES: NusA-like transcription termination signal-binding factor [Halomicrobium]MBO4247448.1 NusA-like transcription termination signal-binding factor [Halomicrobium sp. IBSBa]NLV08758.1 NusA-like transcription termination signal-binding factor [Halomicrobium mukohataei]
MPVELSDEARRLIALFETEADVTVRDCVIDDDNDRVIYVVKAGEMADAIGPGGVVVDRIEAKLDRAVKLIEDADTAANFVANTLAPAAVYNVTISENDDTIAYVEVAQEDRGVAIGADGKNIDAARRLAKRHFDVDGIELT